MTRSSLDQLIVGVMLALSVAATTGAYQLARSQESLKREEFVSAAAQGVFESVSSQLLRTTESLRIAASLLSDSRDTTGPDALVSIGTIPHLVQDSGAIRWVRDTNEAAGTGQRIVGTVQESTDAATGSTFELLTTAESPAQTLRQNAGPQIRRSLVTRISVASLLTEAAYRSEAQQFSIAVFDRHESDSGPIFASAPFNHVADPLVTVRSTLDVFGHPWEIVLRPMAMESRWGSTPDLVLAGGGALTVLLALLMMTVMRARNRIEEARANEQAERNRRQQEELSRQLGERIAQLDRSRGVGEMAFVIGHELSQPLTAINSFAQLGATLTEAPDESRRQLHDIFRKIARNAERGNALLDQIRNFVRGTTATNIRVDVHQIVAEVAELLEPQAQRSGVRVFVTGDTAGAWVTGDALQLSQVLVNVMRNAIQASAPADRPEVSVEIRHDGLVVRIVVRDHGGGFTPEALQQAGLPFFTTKPTGLGLGLTISSNIIKGHGGTLQFRNADDGGAVVDIRLPAAQ